jgi:C_GCAxxG_C_C family probable redox protein
MTKADAAVRNFAEGCACSQAVLAAFSGEYGLTPDMAVKVACGFAGGMKRGDTCGAVTGAYMVLGLALSGEGSRTVEGRGPTHAAVADFAGKFEARHGTLQCRELLGCDISTPDGRAHAKAQNLFATRCAGYVRDAADLLTATLGY